MTLAQAKEYSPAQAVVSVMTRPDQDPIKTTERGMLFSAPLVRAILAERKTETRRPVTKSSSKCVPGPWAQMDDHDLLRSAVRDQPLAHAGPWAQKHPGRPSIWAPDKDSSNPDDCHCVRPHIQTGDTIYVRETHAVVWNEADPCRCDPTGSWCPEHMTIEYRADSDAEAPAGWEGVDPEDRLLTWTPSILMQRDRSRIDLRVTEVCAERVQDIDPAGVRAEGLMCGVIPHADDIDAFAQLWDSIYSTRRGFAWGENPWVWRIKFAVEVKP